MDTQLRETLKNKKRVIVKIGSSSLLHEETGKLNLLKLERLVRELCDIKNQGMDVCLVSSGAIAVGRQSMGFKERPEKIAVKQACAAVGQARLMMTYQKLFSEYHQNVGQVLMTKKTMVDNVSRKNAQNTFEELFEMGIIPIVNENDTVSTYEMQFGDNDSLSAIVASLVGADSVGSDVGTGGMTTKLTAARIATLSGADMIIANAKDVGVLHQIFEGKPVGTFFKANKNDDFYIADYVEESME